MDIYFNGSLLEFYVVPDTGHRERISIHTLQLSGNLWAYDAEDRHGSPRGLGQIINSDCNEVISQLGAAWQGLTFEQAAQNDPDECDDLVDTSATGMHRQQIRLRLYLTLRRQLISVLQRLKGFLRRSSCEIIHKKASSEGNI